VPASPQFLLDLPQFDTHPVTARFAPQ
jgi:hypothetical protein